MCFISKNNFLKLDTKILDNSTPVELVNYEYTNKTIKNFGINKGEIKAYNYLVPFDFDADRLLFLDYESENIRRICIYYTLTKNNPSENSLINQNSLVSHTNNSEFSKDIKPLSQINQLITNANENIPFLSFDTKNKLNVAFGSY
jgi:hypothetical protein